MPQSIHPERLSLTVPAEASGARLDKLLGQSFELSRARFQALIGQGHVSVNQKTIGEARHAVQSGDEITILLPPVQAANPLPETIKLEVIYEDNDLIVINKPAGLIVHPGAGNSHGTLVNALLAHCSDSLSGIGGIKRPGIVHRLDKDTSGLLVAAKTDAAHAHLSSQFAAHGRDGRLERAYLALVWGRLEPAKGTITTLIERSSSNRRKMTVSKKHGRTAITHFHSQRQFSDATGKALASLIDCRLETGRTHQIRVHMAHIGHPLLNDMVYGASFKASENRLTASQNSALKQVTGQALHAYRLGFEHPSTTEKLTFETPFPSDINELVKCLERS